jgi:hypothetical protein
MPAQKAQAQPVCFGGVLLSQQPVDSYATCTLYLSAVQRKSHARTAATSKAFPQHSVGASIRQSTGKPIDQPSLDIESPKNIPPAQLHDSTAHAPAHGGVITRTLRPPAGCAWCTYFVVPSVLTAAEGCPAQRATPVGQSAQDWEQSKPDIASPKLHLHTSTAAGQHNTC